MTELALRVVFSLAIVVGLILLLAKYVGRRFTTKTGAVVHVVHRQPLSRGSAVSVVTVGGRVLVLGMTEQQVTLLTELDPSELEEAAVEAEATAGEPSPERPAAQTHRRDPLTGSVLSLQTWRQALAAVTGDRGA